MRKKRRSIKKKWVAPKLETLSLNKTFGSKPSGTENNIHSNNGHTGGAGGTGS